jgi:glycosyltransferase involved in cell wall biosynthesis
VARLRNKKLVFDAHEHFTELIEVVDRPFVRKIWLGMEKLLLPRVKHAYTVSENLRRIFSEKYHCHFELIRNITEYETFSPPEKQEKYIIYAGVVNAGRGLHEFIEAMPFIASKLVICGKGDIFDELVEKVKKLGLEDKVVFMGYLSPEVLKTYIRNAYMGCLLLENKGLSYYYSLANKFFDYMHAGIPQITINFPEYTLINERFRIAVLTELKVEQIIEAANSLLRDKELYQLLCRNAREASHEFNWQKESEKLVRFYKNIS